MRNLTRGRALRDVSALCALVPVPCMAQDCASWTLQGSSSTCPNPGIAVRTPAEVYFPPLQVTVLYGGDGLQGPGANTWYWSTFWSTSPNSLLCQMNAQPGLRVGQAMAYDINHSRIVMFGGALAPAGTQTWLMDSGFIWTQQVIAGPGARQNHGMAYDAARGRVVLFGGVGGALMGDTWEYDGSAWVQRANTGPSPRSGLGMVYDPGRGRVLLFGGFTGPNSTLPSGETWEWDGAVWALRGSTGPSPRGNYAMTFDTDRERAVLFGGQASSVSVADANTWEWDGTGWASLALAGPTARYGAVMAYDPARRHVMLFGGDPGNAFQETWTYVVNVPPSILIPPAPQTVAPGQTVALTVTAGGSPPWSYQWRRNGVALLEGGHIANSQTRALTLMPAAAGDAGAYDVVVTNSCNSATSAAADLSVQPTCYPNCDHSTTPPVLNVLDFACFLNKFAAGCP